MLINLVVLFVILTLLVIALTATGVGLSKRHTANSPLGHEAKRYIALAHWLGMFELGLAIGICGIWLIAQW